VAASKWASSGVRRADALASARDERRSRELSLSLSPPIFRMGQSNLTVKSMDRKKEWVSCDDHYG
jgi:hypothetical protein